MTSWLADVLGLTVPTAEPERLVWADGNIRVDLRLNPPAPGQVGDLWLPEILNRKQPVNIGAMFRREMQDAYRDAVLAKQASTPVEDFRAMSAAWLN